MKTLKRFHLQVNPDKTGVGFSELTATCVIGTSDDPDMIKEFSYKPELTDEQKKWLTVIMEAAVQDFKKDNDIP